MRLCHRNVICAFGLMMVLPLTAKAEKGEGPLDHSSASCAVAYEHAQELRADGHLRDARRSLQTCVQPECSEFVRSECGRWLSEVESSLPSVVLVAKKGGSEREKVRVLFDDEPLVENLDGKAIVVDPGQHTLKFEAAGAEPVTVRLVFREGEKNRQVVVELGEQQRPPGAVAQPLPQSAVTAKSSSTPNWTGYALTGLGVLGVAGFVTLGVIGNREYGERQRTCAPQCSDSEVSSIRTKYHMADVSLGVGVVALGVGGYLLLASPHNTAPGNTLERGVGFDIHALPSGGIATLGSSF
jgi:hypothetical protein